VLPKRRFLQEPHSVASQKTPFFIVTAVKTSNLTYSVMKFMKIMVAGFKNHKNLRIQCVGKLQSLSLHNSLTWQIFFLKQYSSNLTPEFFNNHFFTFTSFLPRVQLHLFIAFHRMC
jgi:hypothetical protein